MAVSPSGELTGADAQHVSPGSRGQRDGLLVSTRDGVAAVTRLGRTLNLDAYFLPLVWQLQHINRVNISGVGNITCKSSVVT